MEGRDREGSEAHQDFPLQPHLVLSLGPHLLSGIFSKVLERDATEGGRGTRNVPVSDCGPRATTPSDFQECPAPDCLEH